MSHVLPQLAADPLQGTPLTGPLRGYWKHRVFLFGVWYRVAYVMDTQRREVVVIAIGPRGGFYARMRKRVGR